MEAGEENVGTASMKRQRTPLSDSEDNVFATPVIKEGQKRRRVEARTGQENRTPKSSTSTRVAELGIKPDTPMVPSVRSLVEQLSQRREEGSLVQRCISDPGANSPAAVIQDMGFREHLLDQGEFRQRLQRFKIPAVQTSPSPLSPANVCPRTHSNLVSDIHQKLQGSVTPSSKQATRIRQEREKELNQLQIQPLSENAWLKRSSSDSSLGQQGRSSPGSSSPSWIPRSRRKVQWPPIQPWDVEGEAEIKDGSFSEASSSGVEKAPVNTTGQRLHFESAVPAAPVGLNSCSERQLHMEKEYTQEGEDTIKQEDQKASTGNEKEQVESRESGTVMMLSFSEDHSFSKSFYVEDRNLSRDDARLLESSVPHKTNNKETGEVYKVTGRYKKNESCSMDKDEQMNDDSLYNDEVMEPSTDEECRLWRYPRCNESQESAMSDELQENLCAEETLKLSGGVKGLKVTDRTDSSETQDRDRCFGDVSAEIAGSSGMPEDEAVRAQWTVNSEPFEECRERASREDNGTQDQRENEGLTQNSRGQSKDILSINAEVEHMDFDLNTDNLDSSGIPPSTFADEVQNEIQMPLTELQRKAEEAGTDVKVQLAEDPAVSFTQIQVTEYTPAEGIEQGTVDMDELPEEIENMERAESLKKVTFILEPELINGSSVSEAITSCRAETSMSDAELSSHDDTNTSEIIDRMFEEVLEYAGRMNEERRDGEDLEDSDSGIGVYTGDKDKMDTESEKEKSEEEAEAKDDGDELLTFPPSGILSPLSKSVEAVVTPMRLAASQESNPPSLLLTPDETPSPAVESAPLYSIDAYRTQRQNKLPPIQSATPGVQRRAPENSQPKCSVNIKERIAALNVEAGKLQTVINQTLQALGCCTDEEHGRGSLEEAEAEKLLLVSCEKRSALLAEVSKLRAERNAESAGQDREEASQQPCRGTVGITNIQLPLKVEFVCSSHSRTGRPSHFFFILIRYGPCNIVATPLATATDAKNGDTISFPTSVTLRDIRSSFEIDVEVYSLSHASGNNCSVDRATTKSRVTPRKLLNTLTRSNNALTAAALPALNARRSSNFSLVGSHKITLASLGHSKFPLEKMKLEGKIRRLLGDEFQEKVPFLSPLEGNIYLRLESQSHSNVQHQGFLTMFELISGYGVWHRRYFVLEGRSMFYWNHPNDRETKEAEGSISLSSFPNQCVRPVKRDSCARPFTFELASNNPEQQQSDSQNSLAKCWFSTDTKLERSDWMEKLGQVLLDFHTWNRTSATQSDSQSNTTSDNLRESIL